MQKAVGVTICPTVMTNDPDEFAAQMTEIAQYATRVHIDMGDGVFARQLLGPEDVWWPAGMRADLHVMFERPFEHAAAYIALAPQMVIVHAEAEGDFFAFADAMHAHQIEVGVALLQHTPAEAIIPALGVIDHVLIFSGSLGENGGKTDFQLLQKISRLQQLKPQLEFGWDGGANDENARALANGGVDVINCGGYLHGADPLAAWQKIQRAVGNPLN